MADVNADPRNSGTRLTGAWIGLGLLLLGVLAWLIYSFVAMDSEPDEVPPVEMEIEQPAQGQAL